MQLLWRESVLLIIIKISLLFISSPDTNECLDPELYSCPTNRHCVNVELSYTCECDDGFNETNEVCEGKGCL